MEIAMTKKLIDQLLISLLEFFSGSSVKHFIALTNIFEKKT